MADTNQFFILTVTKGSEMIGADGSKTTLNDVPKNALEYWESGNYAFCLKKDTAAELFKDYSKEQIQKLIEIRTPIGYKGELDTLNSLLKKSAKVQAPAEAKKN
ncbi:hypothetical protein [Chryseobacterium sp. ZHDP1]|uniref:hypothetical protein n=1 Tax=Chryseobacterium sp. ZHDP1 TaxID=2838877 RepID=UPI001BDF786A|nr:hypothetical protein [Chryseobacterium sp. ZHDP1]QWA38866.1 hypothetical protein KKI44_01240 [Chryseobacterium sp. ZHDP1]